MTVQKWQPKAGSLAEINLLHGKAECSRSQTVSLPCFTLSIQISRSRWNDKRFGGLDLRRTRRILFWGGHFKEISP
jgi:hypothetical protein